MKTRFFLILICMFAVVGAYAVPAEIGRTTINNGSVPNPFGGDLPCTKSTTYIVYGDNYDESRGAYWTMWTDVIVTITCTEGIVIEHVKVRLAYIADANNNIALDVATLEECTDDPNDAVDRCYEIMQPGDPNVYGNLTNLLSVTNAISGQ